MNQFMSCISCFISLLISLLFFSMIFPISQFIVDDYHQTIMSFLFISLVLSIGFFIILNKILTNIFKILQKFVKRFKSSC